MTELPVHSYLDVDAHHTIYKGSGWWKAVALLRRDDRREVAVYLWKKKGDEWKRQQKLTVSDGDEWEEIESAVTSFLERLAPNPA